MRIVPLAIVANQAFTVTIDGIRWSLGIKEARGVLCVDISRSGVLLLSGIRAFAGEPVIPYKYIQTGNFLFLTISDQLPDWREFGLSQFLVYLNADEISTLPPASLATAPEYQYLTSDDGFYLTTDTGEILTDD